MNTKRELYRDYVSSGCSEDEDVLRRILMMNDTPGLRCWNAMRRFLSQPQYMEWGTSMLDKFYLVKSGNSGSMTTGRFVNTSDGYCYEWDSWDNVKNSWSKVNFPKTGKHHNGHWDTTLQYATHGIVNDSIFAEYKRNNPISTMNQSTLQYKIANNVTGVHIMHLCTYNGNDENSFRSIAFVFICTGN